MNQNNLTTPTKPNSSSFKDLGSIFQGMWVTLKYLLQPKRIVTKQYPENRATLKFPEMFRGQVIMPHDDNNDHTCTACTLCEKACPNGTISILSTKNEKNKRVLGQFIYRFSQCTLCNLCIEACPFDAIRMGHDYEEAGFRREDFIKILNKTEGRG